MSVDIFHIKLGLNSSYLIRGKSVIMIDGGMPNRLNIHPEEIKLIVLTHSHFDHAGSAKDIRDLTGAKIVIHELEKKFVEEGGMIIPEGVNLTGKIT